MSEMSKMVFVALTQHCIQSTDFMSEMSEILHSVYSGPSPRQEGRLVVAVPYRKMSSFCLIGSIQVYVVFLFKNCVRSWIQMVILVCCVGIIYEAECIGTSSSESVCRILYYYAHKQGKRVQLTCCSGVKLKW